MGFFNNMKTNISGALGEAKMKWYDASCDYESDIDIDDEDYEEDVLDPSYPKRIIADPMELLGFKSTSSPVVNVNTRSSITIDPATYYKYLPSALCTVFGCTADVGIATSLTLQAMMGNENGNFGVTDDIGKVINVAKSIGICAESIVGICELIGSADETKMNRVNAYINAQVAVNAAPVIINKPLTMGMNFQQPQGSPIPVVAG